MKSYSYIALFAIFFAVAGFCAETKKGNADTTGQDCAPTIAHYEIEGASVQEIRNQLDIHGPPDSNGISHDAHTIWGIRWNWPGYGSPLGNVSRADITCKVMIILPRLKNTEDLPKELREKWNRYVDALLQHEMEHVAIARECKSAIERVIRKSHPKEADKVATAILREHKEKEVSMDQKTEHGKKNGTRFP
jgi:predicted secreted Zn-dependent protease